MIDEFIDLYTNIEGKRVARFKYNPPLFDGYGNSVYFFSISENDLKFRLKNRLRDKQSVIEEMKALVAFAKDRDE